MAIFEKFPYLNFHSLNLDWLLKKTTEHTGEIAALDARIKALEQAPDISFTIDGDGMGDVSCTLDYDTIYLNYSSNTAEAEYNGLRSKGYIIDVDINQKRTLKFYFQYPWTIVAGDIQIAVIEISIPDPHTHPGTSMSHTGYTYTITLDS